MSQWNNNNVNRPRGLVTASETRYIRLVDGQPTQASYTGLGNVTRSVEVGMKFKPAVPAEELRSVPVAFVDMAAGRTLLGSKPCIDKDDLLAKILCFKLKKMFQLVKRPGIQFPNDASPSTFLNADLGKVFESEYGSRGLNDLLRDAVIDISHKPSFSTRKFTEFPASGSSAFRLKLLAKVRELGASVLHLSGIEKRIVGADCDVDKATVNTENRLFLDGFRSPGLNLAVQVKSPIVPAKGKSRRLDLPRQELPIVIRKCEGSLDPPIGACDSSEAGIEKDPDHTLIVAHSRILLAERFGFTLHNLQRVTGTISRALHQRGREIRNRLSNALIGRVVAVYLVGRMVGKAPLGTGIERHGIIPHGLHERFPTFRRNVKFQLDCPNHNHICDMKDEESICHYVRSTAKPRNTYLLNNNNRSNQ